MITAHDHIHGHVDMRNGRRLAEWRERWFLQGGTLLWPARDLRDLRSDEDRRRHMLILLELRAARRRLLKSVVVPFRRRRG